MSNQDKIWFILKFRWLFFLGDSVGYGWLDQIYKMNEIIGWNVDKYNQISNKIMD